MEETQAQVTWGALPTVTADRVQLEQLFRNLISNALRFHGERPPRVHVAVEPKPEEWLFSVRDQGIGIGPEFKEKIFVIFERLHAGHGYPGTGIGLAVCKRIVERHGGRIWVESQPDREPLFTSPCRGIRMTGPSDPADNAAFLLRLPDSPKLIPQSK